MITRTRTTRLAALSLTGGAVLTVLSSTVAFAGDADSTGNRSSTDQSQSLVATPGGEPTIADIQGGVANAGGSAANTGVVGGEGVNIQTGNATGVGNESTSDLDQRAEANGPALIRQRAFILNFGGAIADTGFNTGADVVTGNAAAWGNRSTTTTEQWAVVDEAEGTPAIVDQQQAVANLGLALAETGWNLALGDDSTNDPS